MAEYDESLASPLTYHQRIDRYTVLLKDGETTATIYPIHLPDDLPPGLLAFLCDEFNMEIDRGDTAAFFDSLAIDLFQSYWFGAFAAVMVLGDAPKLTEAREWEKECLGSFFIKANYPGRCSHICTANFLVNAGIRGKGIGRTLADCFLQWAPQIGFTYALFNLVFESNVAARSIWESLNFKRVGRIRAAGILKGHDTAVDGIIYGRELINTVDTNVGSYRFDKIRFYLETGRYPPMADRHEKLRLRSSSLHYKLVNGKLMLRGREVVGDPVRQLQICTEIHLSCHAGINKTTALVTEKYHWSRIKDTAGQAVRNCPECHDVADEVTVAKREPAKKLGSGPRKSNKNYHASNRGDANLLGPTHMHNAHHHLHHDVSADNNPNNTNNNLLESELSVLDENLMAVVQEAQRSQLLRHQERQSLHPLDRQKQQQQQQQQQQQHHHHQRSSRVPQQPPPPPQRQSYAAAAATAVMRNHPFLGLDDAYSHDYHSRNLDSIPVDPQVSAYASLSGSTEMDIARVIMEASHDLDESEQESKHDPHDGSALRHLAAHLGNELGSQRARHHDKGDDADDHAMFLKG